MNEKESIERETAEAFLKLYNSQTSSSYEIIKHFDDSEGPDFLCRGKNDRELILEITMTEDHLGDIQGLLGRSDALSLEALKRHNEAAEQGNKNILQTASSCLQGNVCHIVATRIQKKLKKDYGPNAALVVRDTSGLPWSWNVVLGDITASLDLKHNPFDEGIWIISFSKNKIFRVV